MKKTDKTGWFAACLFGVMLTIFLVAAAPGEAYAVPANPHPFEFTQQDGSEITLNFRGDEFFHWWEDTNGFVVAYDRQSGNWRYAGVVDGAILPIGQNVGAFDASIEGPGRIQRDAILPLIVNAWRFDPGNPMIEFLNGRVFRDHRSGTDVAITMPVIPTLPTQPGASRPPAIPGFNNIADPGNAAGGGNQINPPAGPAPPTPPPTTPPGGGGDTGIGIQASAGNPGVSLLANCCSLGFAANTGIFATSAGAINMAPAHMLTNQRLLVVMLEFENMQMLRNSEHYHNKYFNTTPGAISVVNYFRDMSGGRNIFIPAGRVTTGGTFNISLPGSGVAWAEAGVDVTITASTHDGVVHAKLHMNHPITAWSSPAGHEASRAALSLVLAAIHENSDFNFGGAHVAAVFAGGEASDNYNPGGQIWAHAWQYQGSFVGQQGWPRYMAYGERQRGDHVMGIGIAVHELGHVLGLPDLYDLTGQSEGLGPYSIMAFGSWGRGPGDAAPSHRPTPFDPWSRIQLGYIEPVILREGTHRVNVNSLNTRDNNVFMVTSPAGNSQYFLIENRQIGNMWDEGLRQWITDTSVGGGIVIFHVDDAMRSANPADMNRNNNNRNHPMVSLREADGSALLSNAVARWLANQNHFFAAGIHSEFNATTNPNSNFFGPGGRNVATGVEIIIHGVQGDIMEIEIILEQSGGATAPAIGVSSAGGSAAPGFGHRAAAAANHARIQNQVAINTNPALTMPEGTTEILLYGHTLQMLVSRNLDLAVNTGSNITLLSQPMLRDILAAGDPGTSFNISLAG